LSQPVDLPLPWEAGRQSIHAFISAHLPPEGYGLTEAELILPDEALISAGGGMLWAAGAKDGVFTHHMVPSDDIELASKCLELLQRAVAAPTHDNLEAFYAVIRDDNMLEYIDKLLADISATPELIGAHIGGLYNLTKHLVLRAPDRGAVKCGVAILGMFTGAGDIEVFRTLGRHDEFTLYCATALGNAPDPEAELWEMAKHVNGWGRIHVVERLAGTSNPAIKSWLLREGYRNSIMLEYLAGVAATTGDLLTALKNPNPDQALIQGAGDIISALVAGGGPSTSIEHYADGAEAITLYLDHLKHIQRGVDDLLVVCGVRDFLNREDWSELVDLGWTAEKRATLGAEATALLAAAECPQLIATGLASEDGKAFWAARALGDRLGVDTWEHSFRRQEGGMGDANEWFHLMRTDEPARIDRVLALASRIIPLEKLATGPALEMGLGSKYSDHNALDSIVSNLERFPEKGWPFVSASLRSPVTRNRNMAVRTLDQWGADCWPGEARPILERALHEEPDDAVKERISRLLDNKPLDGDL
jgi:hypothetical protein